ncbi:hypothetical protein PC9H_004410 [Pleurotus ostreatus]|uniref:Uncharacterized protein n=1 Tax=Pleurotus ostreatus TaxID=5322 RepID=A0A8H7A0Y3_PLEOS|nr:uncharacterized protein PC9H_004410 [Pleurotus ostreatus]KAF7437568.1 hypothetical protein PC9H_004410 [Pleurotus ostreatus]
MAKPLFYQHVALYWGSRRRLQAADCRGYRQGLNSLVRAITANDAALGAQVHSLNLTVPEFAVEYDDESTPARRSTSSSRTSARSPSLGPDTWPVSKLALLPSPTKLTLLTLNSYARASLWSTSPST